MNNHQLLEILYSRVLKNCFVTWQDKITTYTQRKINVDEPPINTRSFLHKRNISNIIT